MHGKKYPNLTACKICKSTLYKTKKACFPGPSKGVSVWEWAKGGYLVFPHLTKLKNIHITEIYMKKQYKSPIIENHKFIKKKPNFFLWCSLKGYIASEVIFRFCTRNKKKALWEYQETNDA